jgi:hypothetical protein
MTYRMDTPVFSEIKKTTKCGPPIYSSTARIGLGGWGGGPALPICIFGLRNIVSNFLFST